MAPAQPSGRKLTYDDFLLFPDDGQRHELIDGEHYVTPSPFLRHQELLKRLSFEVELHLRAHPGQGQVFFAPLDCVISNVDVVEPDLLVVTGDQRHILTDKHIQGTPALVAEILSPGTRRVDLGVKLRLYERAGVREYWVIDSADRRVFVHRRGGDHRLPCVANLAAPDQLTTPLLPGFSLDLGAFFV